MKSPHVTKSDVVLWLWRFGWLVALGIGPRWLKLLAAFFLASTWMDGIGED